MRPKVYITRQISGEALEKIESYCDVRMWSETDVPVPKEVLEEEIKDVDGLCCLITESVNEKLISGARRLKVISNIAVGFNNIDVEYASSQGIVVTNTPDVLTETTADLAFALLMAVARRLPEAANYLQEGRWQTWSLDLLTGHDVYGATLGIIGMGRIGSAVARRAKGFAMRVIYYDQFPNKEREKELGVEYADLETLLRESDFLSIHIPLSPFTENLLGREQLAKMKRNAIIINTSRGGIVDETALYEALNGGVIGGAGLDVFAQEPVPLDNPLLTLPNVLALPHIGSASVVTRKKMAILAAENLVTALQGGVPSCVINRGVLEPKRQSI